ncbi:MAG: hypothetical protein ACTSUE_04845 [Promethearchaeota archaeon]
MRKKILLNTFTAIINIKFPGSAVVDARVKNWSKNLKVSYDVHSRKERSAYFKIKSAKIAQIKNTRFSPFVISTSDEKTSLVGARLSKHAGQLEIELARKHARESNFQLVILGSNVLFFKFITMLDSQFKIGSELIGIENLEARMESIVDTCNQIHQQFYSTLNKILKFTN